MTNYLKHSVLICVLLVMTVGLIACQSSLNQSDTAVHQPRVVLAHGLARSGVAMWLLEDRLEDAGYDVCLLDYDTVGVSLEQLLAQTHAQIEGCLQTEQQVHFVGHSLGGLVIRHYLSEQQADISAQQLGEIVFVGTPNSGSELADHFQGHWLMDWGGEVAQSLSTDVNTADVFGADLPKAVGVIAGTKSLSMTNDLFLKPNDGLVSVASAKSIPHKDFIAIEVGHSAMRYNADVAQQVIYFLAHGEFKKMSAVE